ncbi:MAG: hypothetical protein K6T35_02115, partial [Meiothermus silvanus]|nr:hypothetical protein [Allomeiothermus silvanus]
MRKIGVFLCAGGLLALAGCSTSPQTQSTALAVSGVVGGSASMLTLNGQVLDLSSAKVTLNGEDASAAAVKAGMEISGSGTLEGGKVKVRDLEVRYRAQGQADQVDLTGKFVVVAGLKAFVTDKTLIFQENADGTETALTLADLAVAGPMARSVEDLELGLDIIAGPNRWERPAWRLELPPPRHRALKEYRVAAWLDDPRCRVEPGVRSLLEKAARALADAGVRVDPDARPAFTLEKVADTFFALLQAALAGSVSRDRIEDYAATPGDTPVARTRRLLAMRHREWLSHNERRLQLRKCWEEFFAQWDTMLLPVMPCPAIPHDHSEPQAARLAWVGGEQRSYWDLITWMAPAGACYLPATVVPVGRLENGLPVGVQ